MNDANATIHGAPTYPGGYSARADVYIAKKNFDLAVIDDTTAIALAPKYSGLWRWGPLATVYADRARALEGKGDRERALADYNEAIRLDAGYARAYARRADIYAAKGDRDHAVADSRGDPDQPEIWLRLQRPRQQLFRQRRLRSRARRLQRRDPDRTGHDRRNAQSRSRFCQKGRPRRCHHSLWRGDRGQSEFCPGL